MRIKQKLVLDEDKLTNKKRNKAKDLHFVEMYICTWKFPFGKAHFFGIYPNINQHIYIIYIKLKKRKI